jgi:myb proto-oncogene protein
MEQPLVNPELLKLASSLFTTSSHQQDYSNNQNRPFNPQIHNQIQLSHFGEFQDQVQQVPNSNANVCTTTFTTPCVSSSLPNESHLFEPKIEAYTSNFNDIENWYENGFGSSTLKEDYVPQLSSQNYYYGSDNQNFMYQNSNQILSTPSSSTPTPLNSNSTCILGSNTEDERESYDSCNRLNFEIPAHILEANDFM